MPLTNSLQRLVRQLVIAPVMAIALEEIFVTASMEDMEKTAIQVRQIHIDNLIKLNLTVPPGSLKTNI